jgi:hypothetical protein
LHSYVSSTELIKKSTVYMSVAMYIIRELEDAIDHCEAKDEEPDENSIDEGVAFYTGSLEGTAVGGSADGVLMHALADKRCINFKTCGEKGDMSTGTAKVNLEIFRLFNQMKESAVGGDCAKARTEKEKIVNQLFVPLIQGTLRYAQIRSTDEADAEDEAEGVAFALSVLPMVHACKDSAATTIYENMKPGSTNVDYKAVKSSFESVYSCLQITCADVGGVVDEATGAYKKDSTPCGGAGGGDSGVNVGLAVGLSVGGLVVLALVAMFVKRQRAGNAEFKSSDNV